MQSSSFVLHQDQASKHGLAGKTITTIINGRSTSNRNFFIRTRHLGDQVATCGGVILDIHWVLTAAECVKGYLGSRLHQLNVETKF